LKSRERLLEVSLMHKAKALLFTAALAAVVVEVRDASACGGCFISQMENTQVTGHKMVLSVSQQQTTLWDQISYSGDPSSFAWILPIKGLATVGLSSDAMFQNLAEETRISINSPQIVCPQPPFCGDGFGSGAGGGSISFDAGGGGGPPVTVVAQQTVGPYETVQLMSTDPNALSDWLAQHGYNVPTDIQPVIDAYVGDGFNFLALKLVPGQGISAMRPVRVSTPGASPVLPLRMVAAGTGAITPITLFVLGEGRYDTTNLPSFLIDPSKLVWNWDTASSNYSQLKQDGFTTTGNKGWLIEAGEQFSKFQIEGTLDALVQNDPIGSGYADSMGQGAPQTLQDDLDALFGSIPDSSLWITRLSGELSRAALGADLQLGAAADQSKVPRFFQLVNQTGTPPPCPTFPPCSGTGTDGAGGFGSTGTGGSSGAGWDFWGNAGSGGSSGGGCTVNGADGVPFLGGLALAAVLALSRRRARRS
jgi:hypothetical protein